MGRGFIEGDHDREGREKVRADIWNWFESMGLHEEAEQSEVALLRTPVGELDRQKAINAGWRCEGVAVLLWALGKHRLSPFYEQVGDPRALVARVGFMDKEFADQAIRDIELVDETILTRYAEHILNVNWRLRDIGSRGSKHYNCCNLFREDLREPIPETAEFALLHDDMIIDGVMAGAADPQKVRAASSIVDERHRAANWLIGDETLYSRITCDT